MKQISYSNPILFGDHADPSILRVNDEYYMVPSNCHTLYGMLQMWHSYDLVNWEPLYYILNGSEFKEAWAADLIFYKGLYYVYCFAPQPHKTVFVCTCTDIKKGNWSQPICIPGFEGIDPGHAVDENGKRYIAMNFNRMYQMSDDGLKIEKKLDNLVQTPYHIDDKYAVEGECIEGPKFFKRGEYYYYITAQGGTRGPATSHAVIAYRSKNLHSGYEPSPYNCIIHTEKRSEKWWSKGHGTVFEATDGKWYMVFHAMLNGNRYLGRSSMLIPVKWDDNGWFYVDDNDAEEITIPDYSNGRKVDNDWKKYLSYNKGDKNLSVLYNYGDRKIKESLEFTADGIIVPPLNEDSLGSSFVTYMEQHNEYTYEMSLKIDEDTKFMLGFRYLDKVANGICFENKKIKCYSSNSLNHGNNVLESESYNVDIKVTCSYGVVTFYVKDSISDKYIKYPKSIEISDWGTNVYGGHAYVMPYFISTGKGNVLITSIKYNEGIK